LSRIIPFGSGVHFEHIRFRDLEAEAGDGGDFFIRECPAEVKPLTDGEKSTGPEKAGGRGGESPAEPAPAVDAEAIRAEAYEQGRADGCAEGRKKGREEVDSELHTAAQALGDALEEVSRLRQSLLVKSREDMIRLVMAVVRRVIHVEVEENSEIIKNTVIRAIEAAVESDEYYIRVHPGDLEAVQSHEPLFLAAMKGLENIHFIADETISRGGCRAESRTGDVDSTIETQLEKIESHLRKEILE
jgi:flagellar assembly protein FliH